MVAYGGFTILSHPLIVEVILPFVLIFTIVFGVLQKAKIFGEKKKQIDAIVALVIGLFVISFAKAIGIIVQLSAFLAVALVVVIVFLLLIGSFTKEGDVDKVFSDNMRKLIGIPVIIAFFIAVIYIAGIWDYILEKNFFLGNSSNLLGTAIFVVIIVGTIWFVMRGDKSSGKDKEKEKENK